MATTGLTHILVLSLLAPIAHITHLSLRRRARPSYEIKDGAAVLLSRQLFLMSIIDRSQKTDQDALLFNRQWFDA